MIFTPSFCINDNVHKTRHIKFTLCGIFFWKKVCYNEDSGKMLQMGW